jgi:hypothetical protein
VVHGPPSVATSLSSNILILIQLPDGAEIVLLFVCRLCPNCCRRYKLCQQFGRYVCAAFVFVPLNFWPLGRLPRTGRPVTSFQSPFPHQTDIATLLLRRLPFAIVFTRKTKQQTSRTSILSLPVLFCLSVERFRKEGEGMMGKEVKG